MALGAPASGVVHFPTVGSETLDRIYLSRDLQHRGVTIDAICLLTISQAARELGVSEGTVRAYADQGVLKVVIVGPKRDRAFDLAESEQFKQAHTRSPYRPGPRSDGVSPLNR